MPSKAPYRTISLGLHNYTVEEEEEQEQDPSLSNGACADSFDSIENCVNLQKQNVIHDVSDSCQEGGKGRKKKQPACKLWNRRPYVWCVTKRSERRFAIFTMFNLPLCFGQSWRIVWGAEEVSMPNRGIVEIETRIVARTA